VASPLKCSAHETSNPGCHHSGPLQRDVEHAAEGDQLAPKAQEQLRRRKRLQLLRCNMSNVAEGGTSRRRIGAIDQEYAFSGLGKRPGDGTAHNARAHDSNVPFGREPLAAVSSDADFVVSHLDPARNLSA
jgi:hypothetical protein